MITPRDSSETPTSTRRNSRAPLSGPSARSNSYRLPDARGFASMQHYLVGDTDEARQRMREEILSTTTADIRNFADALAHVAAHGRVVVLGSEQTIAAANAERPGLLSVSWVM